MRADTGASDLQATVQAVETWLRKAHTAFDHWQHEAPCSSRPAAEPAWQEVLQWHAALELSFTQLAEQLEDVTDITDAQTARHAAAETTVQRGIRLLPSARQQLAALPPELQDRLLQSVQLQAASLPKPPLLQGVERLRGTEGLFRIRVHDVRVLFELDPQGATIVAVTPSHAR
jgi:mRNA-degrading endonuclease RelE of RelBE toxin-antitoxin system